MNIKKYLLVGVTLVCSMAAFAYPAPQEDDPTAQLLQQYTAQVQELQKSFEKELLPPLKATAQMALQLQAAEQEELTPEQAQLLNQYMERLDKALTNMAAPSLQGIDTAQFNKQYKELAQSYGLPEQEFTQETVAELVKGMYLMSAVSYFEQSKKLTQEELLVLAEILFPQEEEE